MRLGDIQNPNNSRIHITILQCIQYLKLDKENRILEVNTVFVKKAVLQSVMMNSNHV